MPANNARAAVEAFVRGMRLTTSCITTRPLIATGYQPAPYRHQIAFAPLREAVPLRTRHGRRGVMVVIDHEYVVAPIPDTINAFQVSTASYRYHLLDPHQRELLAYHWHPVGESHVTYPHMHLSGRLPPLDLGSSLDPVALANMHLPTGFVTFVDIIRLLITEFDIHPLRTDWETVLQQSNA